MSVNAKLSKLSASWKKVTPIASSFSNIADGDYIGDIKEMKLGESKKGRTQVTLDWEIADGDFAGKTQKQFYGLTDDKGNADDTGMGYFKNLCEVIGLDLPEDLNLWQDALDEFVANNVSLFEITAKEKNGYTNVYVNGVSEYTKGTEGEVATEEAGTEEELTVEEVTEEEVLEEVQEEVQQVVVPAKKVIAKVTPKAVVKVAAKAAVAAPTKKIVSLNRR